MAGHNKPHDLHPGVYGECSPSREDCVMCKGEACNFCGAGCWDMSQRSCNHDHLVRHMAPYMPKGTADA